VTSFCSSSTSGREMSTVSMDLGFLARVDGD